MLNENSLVIIVIINLQQCTKVADLAPGTRYRRVENPITITSSSLETKYSRSS